ncbi:MAG TPA: PEP-CTERM sorting domain-containing protein [Nitrospirales bacterium]
MTMKAGFTSLIVAITIGYLPLTAGAVPFVSNNPAAVAAFQAGATIQTFEGIAGVTAFNNETPGTVVPATALLKSQITGLTFFSNFAGGPAVLNLTGFANLSDAKSPPNVLSGTEPGTGSDGLLCFTCFIEVTFASPVSKIGAWNDPTGGSVLLLATDLGGGTVFDSATGGQGNFIGVSVPTNQIQRGLFLFVTAQSVNGFSLDDLTYARTDGGGGSTVPEPASLLLFATGAAAIFARPLARKIIARRS